MAEILVSFDVRGADEKRNRKARQDMADYLKKNGGKHLLTTTWDIEEPRKSVDTIMDDIDGILDSAVDGWTVVLYSNGRMGGVPITQAP